MGESSVLEPGRRPWVSEVMDPPGGGGGGFGGGGGGKSAIDDPKRLSALDDEALRVLATQRSPNAKPSRYNFCVELGM